MLICYVTGNSLSIAVLAKDTKASSTNSILKALAVWDIVYLVTTITKHSMKIYTAYYIEDINYAGTADVITTINARVIYPLNVTARFASYAVTLLVTIDRYIAVCKPMTIRSPKVIYISIVVLSLLAAVLHLPTVFEYHSQIYAGMRRETFLDNTKALPMYRTVQTDELWNLDGYLIAYKLIFETIIRDLLTMVLLVVFNYKLYRGLKAVRNRYLRMRRASKLTEARRHISSGESLTRTIVLVVTSFILLNVPGVVGQVLYITREISVVIYDKDIEFIVSDSMGYKKYYMALVHMLSLISTSMNFVFYVVFAKKFKRIFVTTFLQCRCIKRRFEDILLSNSSDDVTANSRRRIKQQPNMDNSDLTLTTNNNQQTKVTSRCATVYNPAEDKIGRDSAETAA